jgi:LAS superfamily LD-carboxypeptidase LdcB
LTTAHLTGQGESHLCDASDAESLGVRVHFEVVKPFLELRSAARLDGFEIEILSGFRDFEKQLSIWNGKATGRTPVLDSNAVPLVFETLSEKELAYAILRWSALPGASRHHWGTELDVFDAATRPEGYEIELIPKEVDSGGMFGALHDWLDTQIESDGASGFFRPYDVDRQGVAPERWHLSFAPISTVYKQQHTVEVLRAAIQASNIALQKVILENLDDIYQRFVINTGSPST